jgi:uncharacterized membrane protein required for colicin V production
MKLLSMLVTGLLEDGLCGDLAAMVAGGEPINSHLARGAAPWPPGHIDVTDSLAPGRGRSGRARFARAVPGYGLNEALADLILVLIVGVNCYLGWRHGLVRRAIACVAVYGGTLAAYYVGDPLAGTLGNANLTGNAWAFVGVFGVAVLMIEILAALYSDLIKRTITVMFDRVAGFAAGLVVGVLELGVVLLVIQAVADAPPSTANVSSAIRTAPAIAVDHGVLTQVIVDLEPGINRLLSPAIPSNIQNRLDQYSAG